MTPPSDTPRLPKWPFFAADATLIAVAWLVWANAKNPTAGGPLIATVVCVVAAAVLAAIPFVAEYAHDQDKALAERQRELEALAQVISSSAEQIGIAATGLQQIADVTKENLKQADQVALALRNRITEYQTQVAGKVAADREAATGLDAAASRLAAAVADASKIETSLLETARLETSKLELARTESAKADSAARKSLAVAIAEFEAKLAAATQDAVARAADSFAARLAAGAGLLEARISALAEAVAKAPRPPKASRSGDAGRQAEPARPLDNGIATVAPSPDSALEPLVSAPLPARSADLSADRSQEPLPAELPARPAAALPAAKAKPEEQPVLGLTLSDEADGERSESAISADGATRLLVTAYIGIGNRLFIRGEGPGLSWEKGVPLQFVSIGKWRWETPDASGQVRFKLYKNDESECASLGQRSIGAGRQEELTAAF
jgi:hypothetical protein